MAAELKFNTLIPRAIFLDRLLNGKIAKLVVVSKNDPATFMCSNPVYGGSDTACVQAALDYVASIGGGTILLMDGMYKFLSQLKYTGNNLTFMGQGPNTVLDFSSVSSNISCIYVHGSISTVNSTLTVTANAGDLTVSVSDGSKFKAGNYVRVRSEGVFQPRVTDPNGAPWTQKMGEIQQIASVANNTITLRTPLCGSYLTTDTATVDVVNMLEYITFKDFKLLGNPAAFQWGINIEQVRNITVENIQSYDMVDRAVNITDCVDIWYTKNNITRSNRAGLGYGLALLNACRNVTCSENHFEDCRHGIACGGGNNYGIQYNQTYTKNKGTYNSQNVGLFGPHPSYDGLTVSDNSCIGSPLGYFNGKNTTIIGNTVENAKTAGISLPSAAENAIVANNTITTLSDHCIIVRSQYGNIDIHDNKLTCVKAGCDGVNIAYQMDTIKVHNNIINVAGTGVAVTTYGGVKATKNIDIDNNEITCTGTDPGISIASTVYDITNASVTKNKIISAADGIYLTCAAYNISNLTIEHNNVTVPAANRCIYLYNTAAGSYLNSSISHNKCFGGLDSIDIQKTDIIDLIENHVYNAAEFGLLLHSNCTNYTVDHNIFSNCATTIQNNAPSTGRRITDNIGYNPTGPLTAPTLPASGTVYTNIFGYPCAVSISGGTITEIAINGVAIGQIAGEFIIPNNTTIKLTYTGTPSWKWRGL
ncbi:MAG: right-handed parallel beta-helix repeat-containing protein [Methanosarcina sp.]|nr:right-handed parallel beta-helix repeat-containing protein [Methanosarcina sp.]